MISKRISLISPGLAVNLIEKGLTVSENVGPVVEGLCEVSHGILPYDSKTIATSLHFTTKESEIHSSIMNDISDGIAASFRESFKNIGTIVLPFSKKIASFVWDEYGRETSPLTKILNAVNAEIIYCDNDIFDLMFYPKEVKNTSLSYTNVPVSNFVIGEYANSITKEDILGYVNIKMPEVTKILEENIDVIFEAFQSLFIYRNRRILGVGSGTEYINFEEIRTDSIIGLFGLYLIVSKMKSSEEPFPWVNNVNLEDYNANISLIWNCLTVALISARKYWDANKAKGMWISPIGRGFTVETLDGTKVVTGSLKLYVNPNAAGMDAISQYSELEIVIGYLATRYIGGKGEDIAFDPLNLGGDYIKAFGLYVDSFKSDRGAAEVNQIKKIIQRAVNEYQKNIFDTYGELLSSFKEGFDYQKLAISLEKDISNLSEAIYTQYQNSAEGATRDELLLVIGNHRINISLAERLCLKQSAQILANYKLESNDPVEKRKALTSAVIATIIQSLLKKG